MKNAPNKVSNLKMRLKQILAERGLRQIDLYNAAQPFCELYHTPLITTDISQYVLGKAEPKPAKLMVLAATLDVSEAWLRGYDVPPERTDAEYTLDEVLAFEQMSNERNQQISKQVGVNLSIAYYRASPEDQEAVRNILRKYTDPMKYPNGDRNGYLLIDGAGLFGIPE